MLRMRVASRAAVLGLALAAVAATAGAEGPRPTPAPSKEACGRAYVQGQHLRAEHKLLAAREALALCALDACPQAVRPDCASWLPEVVHEIPSIAVHAQDASGAGVAEVRVSIDGTLVADKLVGLPIELDPGAHTLRFEHSDSAPIELPIVAVQGEKLRPIDVRFAAPATVPAPPSPEVLPPSRPVPVATWVLGGAGVAAGVVSAVLWASAESEYSSLKSSCAPSCNPSQADPARTKVIAGDVTVGVGGAALASALVLYLLRPSHPADSARLDVTLSPTGAVVGGRLTF